ncbi:MAG: phenylalanine--tRNA ligase subunit alpha [Nitriliruptorales bacterium]|nr:phenylalanine--tRNA ligase subunit alpha [Nitriliruptorales bacterium]
MTDVVDLDAAVGDGLAAVEAAEDLDALDRAVGAVFGKRGAITRVQRTLGQLDERRRRELGRRVNEARADLQAAIERRRSVLEEERDRVMLAAEAVDVTLPARTPKRGSLHPITETMEAMVDAFAGLGYQAIGGPEVETDWFNFTALNIPRDHPARSLHDTIYVEPLDPDSRADSTLLRTHTSPVQARVMLAQPPPVYVVVPGRTYRQDTPDATHLPVFHQIEGLAVDTDLTFADLAGTLDVVARALLGPDIRTRLIPDHFPFTEPSCQLEAASDGGWMELLGAGMVHPNVLRAVGYDPEEVGGFAFGIGVERIAMLRHGISDLRLFIENDLRFLSAFTTV